MTRKLFVKSYGCQMNVYDSHRMADMLAPEGYVETNKIVATADFQQRLDAIGMFPDQDRTPDEINAYIKAEIAKWAKVIADAGVKPAD